VGEGFGRQEVTMARKKKTTRKKRPVAVGYVRVSSDEQTKGHSLEIQESTIKRYASGQGYRLAKVLADPGVSGATFDRPGLNELRDYVKAKSVDVLLVSKLDRLGRDLLELQEFLENLKATGVKFVSIDEGLADTTSGIHRSIQQIIGLHAEMERQRLIERVVPAMAANAKQGRMNGPVPYGYQYDRAKSVVKPHPEEAKVVRWLFREFAKGKQGSKRLANHLTGQGTVNRKGKPFRASTIETMLRNEFYLGHYRWRQNRTIGADSPVEQIIEDHHPALVDRATFEKIQALLGMRSRQLPRTGPEEPFLLTGLLVCQCGRKMKSQRFASTSGDRKAKYYCPARRKDRSSCSQRMLPADEVEQQVLAAVAEHVASNRWRKAIAEHLSRANAGGQNKKLQARINDIEQQLNDLLRKHLDGRVNPEEFHRRNVALKEELSEVQLEAEGASNDQKQAALAVGIVQQLADVEHDEYQSAISQLSRSQQRQLVSAVAYQTNVGDGGRLEIAWRFA